MKRIIVVSSLLCAAVSLLPGCATTAQDLQKQGLSPLTHGQLEMLMSRTRTMRWTTATGTSGTGTFALDGSAELAWTGGGAKGTWRINGNAYCTKYPDIRHGKENCFTFYRTRPHQYSLFFPDGSLDATVTYTN